MKRKRMQENNLFFRSSWETKSLKIHGCKAISMTINGKQESVAELRSAGVISSLVLDMLSILYCVIFSRKLELN